MGKKELHDAIIVSIVVIMVLLHPTLTRQAADIFTCYRVGDHKYLRSDLSINCNSSTHIAYKYLVGILAFLLYPIGIIALTFRLLRNRRHKLWTDETTRSTYGFLYLGYSERTGFFWEAVVMARKVSMVMIMVFLGRGSANVIVQSSFATLVIVAALYLHVNFRPYDDPTLHLLETLYLIVLFLTLMCGIMLSSSISGDFSSLLTVVIFCANLAFIFAWIYFIAKELRGKQQELFDHAHKYFSTFKKNITIIRENDICYIFNKYII